MKKALLGLAVLVALMPAAAFADRGGGRGGHGGHGGHGGGGGWNLSLGFGFSNYGYRDSSSVYVAYGNYRRPYYYAPPRAYYAPAPVVYSPPPVVYAPPPVAYDPAPVYYYEPAPVVYAPPPVVYGPPPRVYYYGAGVRYHYGR